MQMCSLYNYILVHFQTAVYCKTYELLQEFFRIDTE